MDVDLVIDLIDLVFEIILAIDRNSGDSIGTSKRTSFWDTTPPKPVVQTKKERELFLMHPELYVPPATPRSTKSATRSASVPTPKRTTVDSYPAMAKSIAIEVFMLVYMLQQDDGMLTSDEVRIIKRNLRPHRVHLQQDDYKRMKELAKQTLSIDTLKTMIEEASLSPRDISKLMKRLEKVNRVTRRHKRILEFMRQELLPSTGDA